MKQFLNQIFYRNGYLIIGAAWLFTLSFIFSNYWSYTASINGVTKSIETRLHDQEKDFFSLAADTSLIRKLAESDLSEAKLGSVVDKPYGFYIYEYAPGRGLEIRFWNNQHVEPVIEDLHYRDFSGFAALRNGQYEQLQKKVEFNGRLYLAVALIHIRDDYYIENEYLSKGFTGIPGAENRYVIRTYKTEYPVRNSMGEELFYLDVREENFSSASNDWISVTLRIAAIIFILLFLQVFAEAVALRKGAVWGIATLIILVVGLRLLTYLIPGALSLRQFELFDPYIFASDFVHRSLGDLFINTILFFWVTLFVRQQIEKLNVDFSGKALWKRWGILILLCLFLLTATYYGAGIIRSLVKDSTSVSFNVTNFFSLNEYSVIGFVILACIALGFFYLLQILLKIINPLFPQQPYLVYLVISVMGLLYLSLLSFRHVSGLDVCILAWLVLVMWLNARPIFFSGRIKLNITGTLFWLFIFSASITAVLINENRTKELEQRKRLAEKLSLQADRSSEKLLSIALTFIDNYFLGANFHQFRNADSNRIFKESLINENFLGYLNRYDTRLFTFDEKETPLFNDDSTSFSTLNTILTVQGKRTNIPGLYFYETAFDKFSYISKREITDTANETLGYLFIISKPKKYKAETLYPELFKQSNDYDPEFSPFYSYAIYNKYELINNYNEYPFPTRLDKSRLPVEDIHIINKGNYDELWYKVASDKYVVIARKVNSVIEAITLFAYIFCAFLFLVSCFRLLSLILQSKFRLSGLRKLWQLNIRTQVHTTIIFISLFSFVVIGIATISFFINRYNNNNRDRLSRAMQIMVNDLKNKIDDQHLFVGLYEGEHFASDAQLQSLIDEISEIHNTEVNLYDLNGQLKVTSRQIVYEKGILSEKMNPVAYYKLNKLKQVQVVQREHIGKLEYLSIYAPVRDESGNAFAYLNIPYFASQKELNQEISNFLVTIINLNAFIFLIAGVIALFIANRITQSFSVIGDKMKEVNLGKLNEEITWKRDDEIGELVNEYNKMVRKLGESAAALAKSEREGAWREMARQVAHEIKNPLTPMKLSIQYLQKAIDNNSPNVKEMTASVASTLIEQIEHLSKIASDFSQFANIGNTRHEVFDLNEIINSLVELYQTNENLIINWQPVDQPVIVDLDKTQMNRLFTNLIQNAWEAYESDSISQVSIIEELQGDDRVQIRISDKGTGIPKEMHSRIFTPNFTTKSSGTGLGLAMCKSIVEQAKGDIWFETSEEGTTFYVVLPIKKNKVSD